MKKILAIVLATCFALTMVACGAADQKDTEAPVEAAESAPVPREEESAVEEEPEAEEGTVDSSVEEQGGGLEVDRGLFNVSITLPAEFATEGETQEYYDTLAEEKGYKSVTLNDDGSVTYVMTRAQHDEMMAETRASIDESIASLVNNEDYPSFVSIDTNEDYTEFTVHCNSEELGFAESLSVLAFYMVGGMYNAFNGTPVDNIHVVFINDATGDVISESNSSDMG